MKPLLPAIDAASHIREAGFALLQRDRRPVEVADLAASVGIDLHTAADWAGCADAAWWLS